MLRIKTTPFYTDFYEEVFSGDEVFEFNEGLTCLVGCNGSGKSTLMKQIQRDYWDKDTVFYINGRTIQDEVRHSSMMEGRLQDFSLMIGFSEGETVSNTLQVLSKSMGSFVLNTSRDHNYGIILIDGLDSGLSIDGMDFMMNFFTDVVLKTLPEDFKLYLIIACNSYEMCRDCDCISVQNQDHMKFSDYEDYREFILWSAKNKEARKVYVDLGDVENDVDD